MMGIAWVLLLLVASLGLNEWLQERQNPNRDPRSPSTQGGQRQVLLKANRQHHYLASARINGHPVTLLVDTGATDVVIPKHLAAQLQLPNGRVGTAITANGTVRITRTVIDEIVIGNIVLQNIRASINPAMGVGTPVLLGMSALKNIELRQRGGELLLIQTRSLPN